MLSMLSSMDPTAVALLLGLDVPADASADIDAAGLVATSHGGPAPAAPSLSGRVGRLSITLPVATSKTSLSRSKGRLDQ